MDSRRRGRFITAVVLAAAVVLLSPGPAAAHTELIDTKPGRGDRVTDVPPDVTLTFSQKVSQLGAKLQVTGPDGAVAGGPLRVRGAKVGRTMDGDLPGGRYRVTWAVTARDGHELTGRFSFVLDAPADPTPDPTATEPTAEPTAGPTAGPSAPPSPAISPVAATSPHASVPGMPSDMPGMGPTGGADEGALPAPLAIAGLVLLVAMVAGAIVIERVRRRSSAADPPAGPSD